MSVVNKLLGDIAERITLSGDLVRDSIRAGLTETTNGLKITGARYRPVPASSALVWGGRARLVGWSLYANGPVRLVLHDGRDETTDVLAVIDLADQESETQWLGPGGISAGEAVWAEYVGAGRLTGALYLGVVD